MVAYVDVLGPSMSHRIRCHCNSSLVVFMNDGWSHLKFSTSTSNLQSQIASWVAALRATYSASAVDSANVACFLLSQLTASLAKENKFP